MNTIRLTGMFLCAWACIFSGIFTADLKALTVGQTLPEVTLPDVLREIPMRIPFQENRVMVIMYTDLDKKIFDDTLVNAMKEKYCYLCAGIEIINLKDAITPGRSLLEGSRRRGIGSLDERAINDYESPLIRNTIRSIARDRQNQCPRLTVFVDTNVSVPGAWDLGDCDNASVVIIVGKDKTVKYIGRISSVEQAAAIVPTVLSVLDQETNR